MTHEKSRVLVVEDHPMFRERLTQLINKESDMEVCGEADNVQEGRALAESTKPDLVILDITLKGSSGLELIKDLRALTNRVPILVLSMHDESLYAQRALRAGAGGYITKHQSSEEVVLAIRKVLAGEVYLTDKMTSRVLKTVANAGVDAVSRSPIDRLTDRELDVLELLGRAQTSREIAETLHLGLTTVDTYRARIKEKLNLKNAAELQHFATRWVKERE
jgi:DNA-binding NarL/FixJ family response regulator